MNAVRILRILWPAFLMAGVLEVLVFALVNPQQLHLGGDPMPLSAQAVYTISFFVFWAVIATSAAISRWLEGEGAAGDGKDALNSSSC